MRTEFSESQLSQPSFAMSERILRNCVHCGFCTATCPTYVLLGDELDSPRGRIQQIQAMLESDVAPPPETVKHIDRCLSCNSCMTTCPSGVDYMHLVDHAREFIAEKYQRPVFDVLLRKGLEIVFTKPWLFRLAAKGAALAAPFAGLLPSKLRNMVRSAPRLTASEGGIEGRRVYRAVGERRFRVALLSGCVQSALAPEINAAAISVLNRAGVEVVVLPDASCCGALSLHLGSMGSGHTFAEATIRTWIDEYERHGLDAIVTTTSGCGTVLKDYGFMFRNAPELAEKAARVSSLARDISELLAGLDLVAMRSASSVKVAYHSACSLTHGQRLGTLPITLLGGLGFDVREPKENHLCCGSAGTYSLLQPELSGQLRDRKVANLERTLPDVIAAGNIGCMSHIGAATPVPVVHTVELVNWITGGQIPPRLRGLALGAVSTP